MARRSKKADPTPTDVVPPDSGPAPTPGIPQIHPVQADRPTILITGLEQMADAIAAAHDQFQQADTAYGLQKQQVGLYSRRVRNQAGGAADLPDTILIATSNGRRVEVAFTSRRLALKPDVVGQARRVLRPDVAERLFEQQVEVKLTGQLAEWALQGPLAGLGERDDLEVKRIEQVVPDFRARVRNAILTDPEREVVGELDERAFASPSIRVK